MKLLAPKLIPVAIASILCGVAMAGGGKEDHMSMMDKNGDGQITAAEHSAGAMAKFTKMDANKDGMVNAAELDAAHQGMMGKDHDQMSRSEGDKSYDRAGDKTGKMTTSAQKLAAMDADKDGAVSGEEHAAFAQKMFSKIDKDGDGTLTAQEVREGRATMTASDAE